MLASWIRKIKVSSHPRMTYLDLFSQNTEAATNNVLSKKVFLEISQNSQKNTCARVPTVSHACNCIKKETLAQLFSCEF